MGKISKNLERRRQQARIAAAQAQLEATPIPTTTEPPVPAPEAPARTAAPRGHAAAPARSGGLAARVATQPDAAPNSERGTATPGTGSWGNPVTAPQPAQEREPVPSTVPSVAALEIQPPAEPTPKRRRVRIGRNDTQLAPELDSAERGGRHVAVAVAVTTIAVVVAADVGIGRGAAVLGHGWDAWALASGAAGIALILAVARWVFAKKRWFPTRRQYVTAIAAGALAIAAFTVGAATSVVIGGEVMSTTSDAARSYRLSTQMLDDLNRLAEIDELVATDPAQAQARFREFDTAQAEAEEIANRWARQDVTALPAGELVGAVENLKVAGFAAAKAVETREALIGTNDAKLASDVATLRSSYIDAALAVMPAIAETEARFGFSVLGDDAPYELE